MKKRKGWEVWVQFAKDQKHKIMHKNIDHQHLAISKGIEYFGWVRKWVN